MTTTTTRRYYEDLEVGQRFRSPTFEMTSQAIKEFAAQFDPQPFHLDETTIAYAILGAPLHRRGAEGCASCDSISLSMHSHYGAARESTGNTVVLQVSRYHQIHVFTVRAAAVDTWRRGQQALSTAQLLLRRISTTNFLT